jgi:glycosyltransferase involved in cell wall biosynthesis
LFQRVGFYATDIQILRDCGHQVTATNSLWELLRRGRYDCAFLYFYTWSAFAAVIARLLGKRVIATGGADELEVSYNRERRKIWIHRFLFRVLHAFSNCVLAVSSADQQNMQELVGRRKLLRVPHAVDTSLFLPGSSRDMNAMLTIGWMANDGNVRRKGMDTSLRVLAALRKLNPDAYLIIAGTEGAGTHFLRKLADELGVVDSVIFRFAVDESEKLKLMQSCGFYMQLSEFEGFGLAALEALSCGACVVHTGRGGLTDFMHDHGIEVTLPIDLPQVAQLMHEVHRNEARQMQCATTRHDHVHRSFSLTYRREALAAVISR